MKQFKVTKDFETVFYLHSPKCKDTLDQFTFDQKRRYAELHKTWDYCTNLRRYEMHDFKCEADCPFDWEITIRYNEIAILGPRIAEMYQEIVRIKNLKNINDDELKSKEFKMLDDNEHKIQSKLQQLHLDRIQFKCQQLQESQSVISTMDQSTHDDQPNKDNTVCYML